MSKRVSLISVVNYLDSAKAYGIIFDWRELEGGHARRWLIETVPTRREHYHDPEARGQIVLTAREVLAFTEGWWAGVRLDDRAVHPVQGVRLHPNNRAGDYP